MGNSQYKSVVDSNLKVHNLNNLFVIGSSVFPSGGHTESNINYYSVIFKIGGSFKT